MEKIGGDTRKEARHKKRIHLSHGESGPWAKTKKKKKIKGPVVGTLTRASNKKICVLLTEEEDERQLRKTQQRSTIEKRAPHIPYL